MSTDRKKKIFLFSIVLLTFCVRYWYWTYTNATIEDAFIIGRVVRNLINYGIYSFNPPEKVSSATSPFFVLLTLIVSKLGLSPIESAKTIGLICSLLLSVVVFNFLIYFFMGNLYKSFLGMVFYIFLPPIINFQTNGMETSLYALFCGLALYGIVTKRYTFGVFFASIASVIRPDGFVVLGIVALYALYLQKLTAEKIIRTFWPLIIVIFYYVFHWIYFDSLLPQSVSAKAIGYNINIVKNVNKYLNRMFFSQPSGLPVYFFAICGIVYLWKKGFSIPVSIILGWYVVYHLFFMLRAPLFDWYLQPPLFIVAMFAGYGLLELGDEVLKLFLDSRFIPIMEGLGILVLIALLLFSLKAYSDQKLQVQVYEMNVRARAGKWLSENTKRTDVVFTESLGYIGYYCENRFIDWPGLVSPQVTRILSQNGTRLSQIQEYIIIIDAFNPDYLVLRDHEWNALKEEIEYQPCAQFFYQDVGPGYLILGKICPK